MKEFYSFGEEYQQKIVDRINNFLADSNQKSVSVRYIEGGLQPFLWFAFDLAWLTAGIVCLRRRRIVATFDRALNSFTIKQTNAFGTKIFQHYLAEISDLILIEEERYNEGTPYNAYDVFIVMTGGDRLLLFYGSYYNINNYNFKFVEQRNETIKKIREYLNIQ